MTHLLQAHREITWTTDTPIARNHKKITSTNAEISMAIFGNSRMEMCLNKIVNGFIDSSASFWYNKTPISARNSKIHDFLVFQPITGPQNQVYLSLERPGHLNEITNNYGNILETYYFCQYGPQQISICFEKCMS